MSRDRMLRQTPIGNRHNSPTGSWAPLDSVPGSARTSLSDHSS